MSSMTTIRTEEANEKYQQTARRIRLLKEEAEAARTIAEKLDGMYITKRVADKAKEIFPGYHAYLDKTYILPQLALRNSSMSYGETFYIRLCENGGKRIDAEIVKAEADKRESEAVQLEKKLDSFYELVSRYNGLVAEYSAIRDSLYKFFPDIPYAWRRDA